MQDLEISMKARIDKIFNFGYKVLYGGFEEKQFNLGRECEEALDPSVVRVEDNSSLIPGQCHVITRPPTRLAITPLNLASSIPSW